MAFRDDVLALNPFHFYTWNVGENLTDLGTQAAHMTKIGTLNNIPAYTDYGWEWIGASSGLLQSTGFFSDVVPVADSPWTIMLIFKNNVVANDAFVRVWTPRQTASPATNHFALTSQKVGTSRQLQWNTELNTPSRVSHDIPYSDDFQKWFGRYTPTAPGLGTLEIFGNGNYTTPVASLTNAVAPATSGGEMRIGETTSTGIEGKFWDQVSDTKICFPTALSTAQMQALADEADATAEAFLASLVEVSGVSSVDSNDQSTDGFPALELRVSGLSAPQSQDDAITQFPALIVRLSGISLTGKFRPFVDSLQFDPAPPWTIGNSVDVTATITDPDSDGSTNFFELYWSPTGLVGDIELIGASPAGGPHVINWDTTLFTPSNTGKLFVRTSD